jgi:hypothetical protein
LVYNCLTKKERRNKDIKDKEAYVSEVLPQISEQGRDYLAKIARALLLLQSPALKPLTGKDEDNKKPVQDNLLS